MADIVLCVSSFKWSNIILRYSTIRRWQTFFCLLIHHLHLVSFYFWTLNFDSKAKSYSFLQYLWVSLTTSLVNVFFDVCFFWTDSMNVVSSILLNPSVVTQATAHGSDDCFCSSSWLYSAVWTAVLGYWASGGELVEAVVNQLLSLMT